MDFIDVIAVIESFILSGILLAIMAYIVFLALFSTVIYNAYRRQTRIVNEQECYKRCGLNETLEYKLDIIFCKNKMFRLLYKLFDYFIEKML